MKTRLGQLQSLLELLESVHPTMLCGFRFEFVIYAHASINQCHELIEDFPLTDGVPDGVMMKQRMDNQDYIEQLRNTVADAIAAGFNLGRDSTKPTLAQQSWMASALNAAGYNNPKWCRLLNDENKVKIQEEVRLQVDQDDNDAIICDIMKRIITRNPPKAPHLLSGILASGGITKGFTTRLELCKHIFAKYGDRWDKNVMYRTETEDAL